MSRAYPKFLFSDPEDTKSKGPFIVHTLPPKKMYIVNWLSKWPLFYLVEVKDWGDDCTEHTSAETIRAAEFWLSSKLKSRTIESTSPEEK